ncbi:hypothetical protein ABZ722_35880 [Streptomyces longwoodensis]|uniref:hypothetical protein n=1 Tax=Streptomyces longwoodensis TaxID=68231 RepID=UPI0033DF077E
MTPKAVRCSRGARWRQWRPVRQRLPAQVLVSVLGGLGIVAVLVVIDPPVAALVAITAVLAAAVPRLLRRLHVVALSRLQQASEVAYEFGECGHLWAGRGDRRGRFLRA